MHLKRQEIPKNWPIHRKGTKYVVRPFSDISRGIPLLVAMRDMLGIAQNRKEVKRAIHMKNILLNSRPVIDDKASLLLFDVVTIIPSKKNYCLSLTEAGKFEMKEIKESEGGRKVSRVQNKKILKGKKTQLNLGDGNNFLSEIECNTNDSVVVNLKDRKVEKCIPLAEKAKAIVFAGKHAGKNGVVKKIDREKGAIDLDLSEGKDSINVLIKHLMVIE